GDPKVRCWDVAGGPKSNKEGKGCSTIRSKHGGQGRNRTADASLFRAALNESLNSPEDSGPVDRQELCLNGKLVPEIYNSLAARGQRAVVINDDVASRRDLRVQAAQGQNRGLIHVPIDTEDRQLTQGC